MRLEEDVKLDYKDVIRPKRSVLGSRKEVDSERGSLEIINPVMTMEDIRPEYRN